MDIRTGTIEDGVRVVALQGRLNMVSAAALRDAVRAAIDEGLVRIVVDLEDVVFLDSTGLGALISCLKSARQAGGDLRISRPAEQVSMVLKLSNLDRILFAYDSPEEAFRD